jgi:hypothetical protein
MERGVAAKWGLLRAASRTWPLLLLALPGAKTHAETIVWCVEDPGQVGTHSSEVVGTPDVVESDHGPAVAFDGIGDGILVPLNPVAGWPRFTIEVLMRPDAGGAFEQRFLHLGEPTGARALLELRLRTDGRWYLDTFVKGRTGALALLDETRLHPAGQWHWVALRYDGLRMAHFVDGTLELERELVIPPLPPGQSSLGMRMTRVSWFKGAIRAVSFHDSALATPALQRTPHGAPAACTAHRPSASAQNSQTKPRFGNVGK